MNDEEQRDQFELWVMATWPNLDLARRPIKDHFVDGNRVALEWGEYRYASLELGWQAWQDGFKKGQEAIGGER